MEPIKTKEVEKVIGEQSGHGMPPQMSTSEKPARPKLAAYATIAARVAIVLAVNTLLTFAGSKFTSLLGPNNTIATSESRQSTTIEPTPPVAVMELQLDERPLQRFPLATVGLKTFRVEKSATGKIAFNEDALTPIFSFYAGRIVRLIAKPGDLVEPGSPLFEIDTPDLMQAESDLLTAGSSLAKAKTALSLARRTENRQHDLYLHKAVALKEWEEAQSDLNNAESDVRAAEAVLAAARGPVGGPGQNGTPIAPFEAGDRDESGAGVGFPDSRAIIAR